MARTGRPPKSTEQRKLEGTLRPDRHATTPMIVAGRGDPEPSPFLTNLQLDRFRCIVDTLRDAKLLDSADSGMVELAAIEQANVVECNMLIVDEGLTMMGVQGGTIANPAVAMRSKSLNHLRQLYAELGIGPASRARFQNLGIKPAEPERHIAGIGSAPTPIGKLRAVGGK